MLDNVVRIIVDEIDGMIKDGRSYRWIGKKLGLSYGTVQNLHQGSTKKPEMETLVKAAEGLGISIHNMAHLAFDLDPPEDMMEMEGALKEICDIVVQMDEGQKREVVGYLKRMLEEGSDAQDTTKDAQAGHG